MTGEVYEAELDDAHGECAEEESALDRWVEIDEELVLAEHREVSICLHIAARSYESISNLRAARWVESG